MTSVSGTHQVPGPFTQITYNVFTKPDMDVVVSQKRKLNSEVRDSNALPEATEP